MSCITLVARSGCDRPADEEGHVAGGRRRVGQARALYDGGVRDLRSWRHCPTGQRMRRSRRNRRTTDGERSAQEVLERRIDRVRRRRLDQEAGEALTTQPEEAQVDATLVVVPGREDSRGRL